MAVSWEDTWRVFTPSRARRGSPEVSPRTPPAQWTQPLCFSNTPTHTCHCSAFSHKTAYSATWLSLWLKYQHVMSHNKCHSLTITTATERPSAMLLTRTGTQASKTPPTRLITGRVVYWSGPPCWCGGGPTAQGSITQTQGQSLTQTLLKHILMSSSRTCCNPLILSCSIVPILPPVHEESCFCDGFLVIKLKGSTAEQRLWWLITPQTYDVLFKLDNPIGSYFIFS